MTKERWVFVIAVVVLAGLIVVPALAEPSAQIAANETSTEETDDTNPGEPESVVNARSAEHPPWADHEINPERWMPGDVGPPPWAEGDPDEVDDREVGPPFEGAADFQEGDGPPPWVEREEGPPPWAESRRQSGGGPED